MELAPYLLGLGTGVVAWLGALGASTFLQDREYFRRQRGAVGVLITELGRVRSQLGGTDGRWIDSGILGHEAAIPGLHPWTHGSIVEAAQSDPTVLGQFMHLEMRLSNQDLFVRSLRERRSEVPIAVDVSGAERSEPIDPTNEAVVQRLLERLRQKQASDQQARAVRDAVDFVNMNHHGIVSAISALDQRLRAIDAALLSQPRFEFRRLLGTRVALLRDKQDPAA